MKFYIKTIHNKDDLNGYLNAIVYGYKHVRTTNKIVRVLATILAIPLWLLALFVFLAQLFTGDIRVILRGVPLVAFFAAGGCFIYFKGNGVRLKSKDAWKSYPHKGEEFTYCFYENEFTLNQRHAASRMAYSGLIRVYEDAAGFYLFDTPHTAHILPKRDFGDYKVDEFAAFISASTGLAIERN